MPNKQHPTSYGKIDHAALYDAAQRQMNETYRTILDSRPSNITDQLLRGIFLELHNIAGEVGNL